MNLGRIKPYQKTLIILIVIAAIIRKLLFSPTSNIKAFLMGIRNGESSLNDDAYNYVFGSTEDNDLRFTDMSDHPSNTGEYNGLTSYNGVSTHPAGAYQFEPATWNMLKAKCGLPDFSPASQDAAAIELIRIYKGYDFINQGNITQALQNIRSQWASLPTATDGQPTKSLAEFLNVYNQYGGKYAA